MHILCKLPTSYLLKFSHSKQLLIRIAGSTFIYSTYNYQIATKIISPKYPCDAAFSIDDKYFAISSTSGDVEVFDTQDFSSIKNLKIKNVQDCHIAFYDQKLLISTGHEVLLWSLDNNKLISLLKNNNSWYLFKENNDKLFCYNSEVPQKEQVYKMENDVFSPINSFNYASIDKISFANKHIITYAAYIVKKSNSLLDQYNEKFVCIHNFISYLENIDLFQEDELYAKKNQLYYRLTVYESDILGSVYSCTTFISIDMFDVSSNFSYIAVASHDILFIWDCRKNMCYQKKLENISYIKFIYNDDVLAIGTWFHGYIISLKDIMF